MVTLCVGTHSRWQNSLPSTSTDLPKYQSNGEKEKSMHTAGGLPQVTKTWMVGCITPTSNVRQNLIIDSLLCSGHGCCQRITHTH